MQVHSIRHTNSARAATRMAMITQKIYVGFLVDACGSIVRRNRKSIFSLTGPLAIIASSLHGMTKTEPMVLPESIRRPVDGEIISATRYMDSLWGPGKQEASLSHCLAGMIVLHHVHLMIQWEGKRL